MTFLIADNKLILKVAVDKLLAEVPSDPSTIVLSNNHPDDIKVFLKPKKTKQYGRQTNRRWPVPK